MSTTSRTVAMLLAARRSAIWVRPRKPSSTTTTVAFVRSTMSAASEAVYREFTGTRTPPA